MRHVGDAGKLRPELLFDRFGLLVPGFDPLADLAHLGLERGGILALLLEQCRPAALWAFTCAFNCSTSVSAARRWASSPRKAATSNSNPRAARRSAIGVQIVPERVQIVHQRWAIGTQGWPSGLPV